MQTYIDLIRRRKQFRYVWLSQVVSMLGDWFNAIATVILVNRLTDSSLAVGGLFLARSLPPFVLGPIAGVVADRFSRKAVMITSDALRVFIVLGFLFVDSPDKAWLIYVLTVAQFIVSSFFEPARAAILPSLVEENELLTANTLSSATWSAMLTIGAALGGIFAAAFGVAVALIIDAATFALSALFLSRVVIERPVEVEPGATPSGGWSDFVEGLRYVRQRPDVGWIAVVKALGQVGNLDVVSAFYAERVFVVGEDGALTLGLLMAALGVGAVLGPLVRDAIGGRDEPALEKAITVGFSLLPIAWLLVGIAPTLPIAMIGAFLRGVGASINWTYSSVLLQMKVPDRILGRVFALDFAIFTFAMSLSVGLTSLALDQLAIDPRGLSLLLAAGSVLPFVLWNLSRRWQRARELRALDAVAGSE